LRRRGILAVLANGAIAVIVDCPNCGKQISTRAELCPHCGFARGGLSEDQLREFRRRKMRDRIYHLKMASYVVITLFLAAFGWYWWDTEQFQHRSSMGPVLLLAVGMVLYVAVRVLLVLARRDLKKLG